MLVSRVIHGSQNHDQSSNIMIYESYNSMNYMLSNASTSKIPMARSCLLATCVTQSVAVKSCSQTKHGKKKIFRPRLGHQCHSNTSVAVSIAPRIVHLQVRCFMCCHADAHGTTLAFPQRRKLYHQRYPSLITTLHLRCYTFQR